MWNTISGRMLIIFSCFFIAVIGVIYYFRDGVKAKGLAYINSNFEQPLTFQEASIIWWKDFPNASLKIEGVRLPDTKGDMLFGANSLYLSISVWDLLKQNYRFRELTIQQASLNILYDKAGKPNFLVVKSNGDSESNLALQFDKINLEKVELNYVDPRSKQSLKTNIINGQLIGAIRNEIFEFDVDAQLLNRFYKTEGLSYFAETPIKLDGVVHIDTEKQFYDFKGFDLTIANSACKLDGFLDQEEQYSEMDFLISSEKAELESLLGLLPDQYRKRLDHFKSTGSINLEARLKGAQSAKTAPAIDVVASLKGGTITSPMLDENIKNVRFEVRYSNGKGRSLASTTVDLSNFSGFIANNPINLDLKVSNLDDPVIDLDADGHLDVASVYRLFPSLGLTTASGTIELNDLRVKGRARHLKTKATAERVAISGQVQAVDLTLDFGKERLVIPTGKLTITNNQIVLDPTIAEYAGSSIEIDGHLKNILPAAISWAEPLGPALEFAFNLNAEEIDLQRLVQLSGETTEFQSRGANATATLTYTEQVKTYLRKLNGSFNGKVDNISFGKIKGRDFNGQFILDDQQVIVKGDLLAMEGMVELDGKVEFDKRPVLFAILAFKELNSKLLFQQTDNFGQEWVQDRHLSGKLTALSTIQTAWNEDGVFLKESININSALALTKGELRDFDLLDGLSTYIHSERLRNIKFWDIQTFINVRNNIVFFPYMEVHSSAGDLALNGMHSFDNRYQYFIEVDKLEQMVIDRLRKKDKITDMDMTFGSGLFKVRFKVSGEGADYDYKVAGKETKEAFAKGARSSKLIYQHLKKYYPDVNILNQALDQKPEDKNIFNQFFDPVSLPSEGKRPDRNSPSKYDPEEDEEFLDMMSTSSTN